MMSIQLILKKTVLLLLLTNSILTAQNNAHELFDQANELYKQGKFEQAYDKYQKISDKDVIVYYNLGNCAYKLSQFGYALLYWRKAEREWGFFNRGELLNNIKLVKKHLKDRIKNLQNEKQEEHGSAAFIQSMKNKTFSFMQSMHLFYLQLLFLFVWLLLFFYIRYLYKKKQKFIIVLLFMFVALCGSLLAIKYGVSMRQYGVVVKPQVSLLSGPGTTYHVLVVVPEGKEGLIYKESHGFYKAKINGIVGWIKRGEFEKV